ncbi:hypothetical protein BC828DRAFT_403205 [Blastocladiella britannica]|nr:hypothetical protein BC828DRAFT_403205 [Blastocladiella britannica]
MSSLSFTTNAAALRDATNAVVSAPDAGASEPWLLTAVAADGEVSVRDTGAGLGSLIEELDDAPTQELFALARIGSKLVLVCWCGEGVPALRKSKFPAHLDAAAAYWRGVHVRILARDPSDVEESVIRGKLAAAGGALYNGAGSAAASMASAPPSTPPSRPPVHSTTRAILTATSYGTPKPPAPRSPSPPRPAKPPTPTATFAPRIPLATKPAVFGIPAAAPFRPSAASMGYTKPTPAPSAASSAQASSLPPSGAGEKSARQLELEEMMRERKSREDAEYAEEMAKREARRSHESIPSAAAVAAQPPVPAAPVPTISAHISASILSAPASSPYSPRPAVAPVPAFSQQQQQPTAAPVASNSTGGTGSGGVAATAAKFTTMSVSGGNSPAGSPRTARKWPTVGSSSTVGEVVKATSYDGLTSGFGGMSSSTPAAVVAAPPTPPRQPAVVAATTTTTYMPAVHVAAAPVLLARQQTPEPEPVLPAYTEPVFVPSLPPRDPEPVYAPALPPREPTPEPAAPAPVSDAPLVASRTLEAALVAVHAYPDTGTPADPTDLVVSAGELVYPVGDPVDGWLVCETYAGTARGMVPQSYLDRAIDVVLASDAPGAVCVAEFEYAATSEEELTFVLGSVVVDVRPLDDDWLDGRLYGTEQRGYFPAAYVKPLAE